LKHVRLGYNYRMSELHAALGLAQLERIEEILAARAGVARVYSEELTACDLLRLPADVPGMKRSWFVYVVQVRGPAAEVLRDQVRDHLQSKGIASQVYFPSIHRQPYWAQFFHGAVPELPNTDQASNCSLALPFSSRLTVNEVRFICGEVMRALEAAERAHLQTVSALRPAVSPQ
jgi:perosamine synthetase